MKLIRVTPGTCISSGLSTRPWEQQAQSIEIDDTPLASGAQGEISAVARLDGQHAPDLLVKRFLQGFPPSMHEMMAAVRSNHARYRIADRPALRALPLFLFSGTLQGQPVDGYVMRRVTGQQLSDIFSDVNAFNTYINLPWAQRLELCRQFVEGMDILYSLHLIHADLNGQNLLVDMVQTTLTIIDLDGGAVAGTGLTPVTIGKLEPGWLAPEIMRQLAQTTQRQVIPVGMAVDLWSMACGVHQLLFGLAPFFFMAQQEDIPAYLARYTWPHLKGLQGLSTHNHQAFGYYERVYAQSPAAIRRFLAFAFQKGYGDPAQRPTASQWLQECTAALTQHGPVSLPPAPPPAPPASPGVPSMIACPACGHDNSPTMLYCQYCAALLGAERLCPHSARKRFVLPLPGLARFGRHWTPETAQYCTVCGERL